MDIERYGDCKVVSIVSDRGRGRTDENGRRQAMSINVKKYTKDQMAKMVEEATERQEAAEAEAAAHFKAGVKLAEENEKLRGEIGTLTEKLDQMNGEAITRENEIANLKADADVLRNKLADTEAALGRLERSNSCFRTGSVIDTVRAQAATTPSSAPTTQSHRGETCGRGSRESWCAMSKPRYSWWGYVKAIIRRHVPDRAGVAWSGFVRKQRCAKSGERNRIHARRRRALEIYLPCVLGQDAHARRGSDGG